MVPDYLKVMLSLLRRDVALVVGQWRLACDLAAADEGPLLETIEGPARMLVRVALHDQVAQGLARLLAPEEGGELGLASLAAALAREGENNPWAHELDELIRSEGTACQTLPKEIRRATREEAGALPLALQELAPNVLVRIQNVLDGLAGSYLGAEVAA